MLLFEWLWHNTVQLKHSQWKWNASCFVAVFNECPWMTLSSHLHLSVSLNFVNLQTSINPAHSRNSLTSLRGGNHGKESTNSSSAPLKPLLTHSDTVTIKPILLNILNQNSLQIPIICIMHSFELFLDFPLNQFKCKDQDLLWRDQVFFLSKSLLWLS